MDFAWIRNRYHLSRIFLTLLFAFLNPFSPLFGSKLAYYLWLAAKQAAMEPAALEPNPEPTNDVSQFFI